ncbi:cyclin 6 [Trypanosoma grayi]|uniref:cyclin 6 n=1 Tax=Trypanosoma grayi TaxID=71804 RepID=UPI0004F3F536|nr:cyclin 6 [Trypanosoma grayi]KEG10088.1 cyclin 6 [Trypanosoma grayi]
MYVSSVQGGVVTKEDMHELAMLTAMALQQRCTEQRHYEPFESTIFHSCRIPQISLWDYVRRIAKYFACSPSCFVQSIIFLDRYVEASNIPITFHNVHRLMITAAMVSAKLNDDACYNNAYYAHIGGISNAELNSLELAFLKTIGWCTWVEPNEYERYFLHLQLVFATSLGSEITPQAPGYAINGIGVE